MLRTLNVLVFLAVACPAVVRADLLAHLPFDGNLADASGRGHDGVFVGGDVIFVEGFDGVAAGAVSFDGVDDYVALAQGNGLPIANTPAFTVAMWVKGPVQTDRRVFSEGSTTSGTPLWNLGTHNTGASGALNSFLRPGPAHRQTATTGVFDDTWHHIAWVDRNGRVDVYVDGVRDAATLHYTRAAFAVDTTTVGGILRASACCWFAGAIDDVRIYDHGLTEAEVQALVPTPASCPDAGDTHCALLDIASDGLGGITATATASDDGGDPVLYTFTASDAGGIVLQSGPGAANVAQFQLAVGTWTVACTVDDDLACFDRAADATCSAEVVVTTPPQRIGCWSFDGDLLDSSGNGNHGTFFGDAAPSYVEGFDGTPAGAILFDGVDDYVRAAHASGLPIYGNEAYTVAMWVKGGAQADKRVFSEGSTTDASPLVNIGTDNAGTTGALDIFIRLGGATLVGHAKSSRNAYDGTWHHIAWVDDGGAGTMYIDGVAETLAILYVRPASVALDTTTIGGILRATPCCWFNGAIDEVCVFNYALDADEVRDLVEEPAGCPGDADTHCTGLTATGPSGGVEGSYTVAADATDTSGDPLWHFFHLESSDGTTLDFGPQTASSVETFLTPGTWSITATVDDSFLCRDDAGDATCTIEVEVLPEPPAMVARWSLDGDLLDSGPFGNDGAFVGGAAPAFVPGRECADPGAVAFDGVDDFVRIDPVDRMPLAVRRAFSIAMWVRGQPQADRRVFSESNTRGNNATLYNLGTDNTGATAAFDFFFRNDANQSPGHLKSQGAVFDGAWHHIAWIDDRGAARLFIDGQLDPVDFSYTRSKQTLDLTTIGGIFRQSACCWFNGAIDDVRLFNYALGEEEVLDLYGDGARDDCCPTASEPEYGDTHCQGLEILRVGAKVVAIASAIDGTGDDVRFTFTATAPDSAPIVIGPQGSNEAELMLAPGEWEITVTVDDDPDCPDAAADVTCRQSVVVCPTVGDTHCNGVDVSGPEGGVPGDYTVTATATDDSGDAISYTFMADNGTDGPGNPIVIGPQAENSAVFTLDVGPWTLSASVDDDPACPDVAGDASCAAAVTVVEPGGLQLPGDCNQDGMLNIADASCIFGVLFLGTPARFPCGDGTKTDPANVGLIDWQPDERIDISDGTAALNFLFIGGPPSWLGRECIRIPGCDQNPCR